MGLGLVTTQAPRAVVVAVVCAIPASEMMQFYNSHDLP